MSVKCPRIWMPVLSPTSSMSGKTLSRDRGARRAASDQVLASVTHGAREGSKRREEERRGEGERQPEEAAGIAWGRVGLTGDAGAGDREAARKAGSPSEEMNQESLTSSSRICIAVPLSLACGGGCCCCCGCW